ncbi:MAG TPA: UDP-2,3-diacylglucosamine diphosphatase LpxI [Rubellimicrobium sp.]|nr:UDP-2,3-diacylglucosamine diphosphatase LpxI [Rubellimicrobium sp.]
MIALIGSLDPLTALLATTLRAQGRPHIVCTVGHRTVLDPPPGDPVVFRVEHLGTLLKHLGDSGVRTVCFSGGIRRPQIDPAQIDARTAPLVPLLLGALRQGDDGALRVVLGIFEGGGFEVLAAHDLVPELLPHPGVLSALRPNAQHDADAARAEEVHRILAPADIGQGVIVRRGQVLAVEAQPGTDFMLRSVKGFAEGALFFKAPKLGQDRRADLPVIGPTTVERAQASKLSAIVIEAGGVMVLNREATVAAASAAGLVLWVREPGA